MRIKAAWHYQGVGQLMGRKVLAGRMFLFKYFSDPISNAVIVDAPDFAEGEIRKLRDGAAQALRLGSDRLRNGESLASDTINLDEHIKDSINWATETCPDILMEVVDALKTELQTVVCSHCTTGTTPICCNNPEHDRENVNSEPLCFGDLREIIDCALKWSAETYEQHLPPSISLPEISLAVSLGLAMQGKTEERIGASTKKARAQGSGKAILECNLDFHVNLYNQYDYFSIPYVIFHEIFVHVFQSLVNFTERENCGAGCVFTEGVLDCLAAQVLRERLPELNIRSPWRDYLIEKFRDVSDEHHRARHRLADVEDERKFDDAYIARSNRALGYDVFERLVADEARSWKFGRDVRQDLTTLNVILATKEQRRELSRVLMYLSRRAIAESPKMSKFQEALRLVVGTREVKPFIATLQEIVPRNRT